MDIRGNQLAITYVPAIKDEPITKMIISLYSNTTYGGLKKIILDTLGKKNVDKSNIIIGFVENNYISETLDDSQLVGADEGYGSYLFAFDLNDVPNSYSCNVCLIGLDNRLTVHIGLKNCYCILCDTCFEKEKKLQSCPVCLKKFETESFRKIGPPRYCVPLLCIQVILRQVTTSRDSNILELTPFDCPRLLRLPETLNVTVLHELIKQAIPQGKYTLHFVCLLDRSCSKCNNGQICTGYEIPMSGIVMFESKTGIAVNYSEVESKKTPKLLHTITQHIPSKNVNQINMATNQLKDTQSIKGLHQEIEDLKKMMWNVKITINENQSVNKINPFENLKFSGSKHDCQHPKRFIETFERFAIQENLDENNKQYYFMQSLVDDAAKWFKVRGYRSYSEMKEAFINFYWNPQIQDCFLKFLQFGKYNKDCGLSMRDYFYKYANEAKFLNEAPSEEDVVKFLIRHFESTVKNEFQKKEVKNIDEAVGVLIKLEQTIKERFDSAAALWNELFK